MDIMDRVRALPQELLDAIFPYVLLPEIPPHDQRCSTRELYYTMPVARTKTNLSFLVSLMDQILEDNAYHSLNYAQATLCIVRMVQIYDLFKFVADQFFCSHIRRSSGSWQASKFRYHVCSVLEASGHVRLGMLALECSKARGDADLSPSAYGTGSHYRFKSDLLDYSAQMYSQDIPTFLLHANEETMTGGYWDDDCEWFLRMGDDKVQALYARQNKFEESSAHWLKRDGGPWVLTTQFASIKSYDENGRGGVMEWSLGIHHYQIEFDNSRSTHVDAYLCSFVHEGILIANQARNDTDLAKKEEKERNRGAMVAALGKETRAQRTRHEGRFWCLA